MPWILGFVSKAVLDDLQRARVDVVRGADAIARLAEYTRDASPEEEFAAVYIESTIEELTPLIMHA